MIVFVYGTLKRGYYNHELLLRAKFLGLAITKLKYPMVNTEGDFPYLINEKNHGRYIKGELFEIDTVTEKIVDILENYPHLYTKEDIDVIVDKKEIHATAYFVKRKITYNDSELLEEFF